MGKPHSLLDISLTSDPTKEAVRTAIRLMLVTGTYILQEKCSKFMLNEPSICKLCEIETENMIDMRIDVYRTQFENVCVPYPF